MKFDLSLLGCGEFDDVCGAIRQRGSVKEYVQEFEVLVAQAIKVVEEQVLGYFLAGLQEGLRNLIRPHDQQDLLIAMERARDVKQVGLLPWVNNGGAASKGGQSWGQYQASTSIIARIETYSGTLEGSGNTSGGNGSKREGILSTMSSKVGSNVDGGT